MGHWEADTFKSTGGYYVPRQDLLGIKFGILTPFEMVKIPSKEKKKRTKDHYRCRCDCGREVTRRKTTLKSGISLSCGKCDYLLADMIPFEVQIQILETFTILAVDSGMKDIAKKIGELYLIPENDVKKMLDRWRGTLNTYNEVNFMASDIFSVGSVDKAEADLCVTPLRALIDAGILSGDMCKDLTKHEKLFAWTLHRTGDVSLAIKEADLVKHLDAVDPVKHKIMCIYLQKKSNIVTFLEKLRIAERDSIDVTAKDVQYELLLQIEQLKAQLQLEHPPGNVRRDLIKCIELLGKSCSAFTEKIQVETLTGGTALDKLIQYAELEAAKGDKKLVSLATAEEGMIEYAPVEGSI